MGDPEIHNDEKVLVRTPGVYVKSIPFEGILTSRRVILVDRAKNLLPPKEIPFATIRDVETGENAIRDQILTLSVIAKTGETRQMILTFSRQEGGNRIKERDEWARVIRQNIGTTFDNVIRRVIPGSGTASHPAEPAAPVHAPVRRDAEGIHPIKKIIGAGTVAPVQPSSAVREFDASTLGQNVFCSRCGNKVPVDSAFCNRCGSPVVAPAATPAPAPQPVSSIPAEPVPSFTVPSLRPIDRDIQTIEPLIEKSTTRIPSDPLRTSVPDVPLQQSLSWDDDTEDTPAGAPAPVSADAAPSAEKPAEKKGFLPRLFSPRARTQEPPKASAPSYGGAPPVPSRPGRSFMPDRKILLALGGIIVLVLIVAVVGLFVYPMLTSGGVTMPTGTGDVTPSPTSSAVNPSGTIVAIETPTVSIPAMGVFVHVNYLGGFKGDYGMPDALTTIPGNSGERVWEVENATGTVQADFEKLDGSSHELLVEIYKNGAVLTKGSTTIGHGTVKLSVDTNTGIAAAPVSSGGNTAGTVTTPAAVATTGAAANKTVTTAPAATTNTTTVITKTTTAPATNTTASP